MCVFCSVPVCSLILLGGYIFSTVSSSAAAMLPFVILQVLPAPAAPPLTETETETEGGPDVLCCGITLLGDIVPILRADIAESHEII